MLGENFPWIYHIPAHPGIHSACVPGLSFQECVSKQVALEIDAGPPSGENVFTLSVSKDKDSDSWRDFEMSLPGDILR